MGRERRDATRVPLAVDFCMLRMDEETNVLCIPKNISATGILLDLTLDPDLRMLTPGDVVVLDNFPETMHQLITTRPGEVVWTRQGLCGVRFFSPLSVR